MTDQHDQGCHSLVLQLTLQGTEVKVLALIQLIRPEQVGYDHDIDGPPMRWLPAPRAQRAREAARSANHGSRKPGKRVIEALCEQRRVLREGARALVQ